MFLLIGCSLYFSANSKCHWFNTCELNIWWSVLRFRKASFWYKQSVASETPLSAWKKISLFTRVKRKEYFQLLHLCSCTQWNRKRNHILIERKISVSSSGKSEKAAGLTITCMLQQGEKIQRERKACTDLCRISICNVRLHPVVKSRFPGPI